MNAEEWGRIATTLWWHSLETALQENGDTLGNYSEDQVKQISSYRTAGNTPQQAAEIISAGL